MTTFDAQCANCGKPQSAHTPDLIGENKAVALQCPEAVNTGIVAPYQHGESPVTGFGNPLGGGPDVVVGGGAA